MRRVALLALSLVLLCAGACAAAEVAEAPISLSDPGGQGLALENLDVRLAAHGPIALTELEMVFRNPLDRQIEGKFICSLPTGATLSRFAKEVDGRLVEGEVVERLRATQVYTEILHTMRDPALLEQDQGNRFKARVFPIAPKGTVRLLLSYSTVNPVQADGQRRIAVPLRGLPKIGRFKFLAICRPLQGEKVMLADASGGSKPLGTKDRITFSDEADRQEFVPAEDLVLTFAPGAESRTVSQIAAGQFLMTIFRPPTKEEKTAAPEEIVVLVDTSASGAASGKARVEALGKVLEGLEAAHPGCPFVVEAFDLEVVELGRFKGGEGQAAAVAGKVATRHFLGATDLEKLARHAGELARKDGKRRVFVVVTDGIPTMGTKEAADLARALGAWPQTATLHVLVIGPIQDERVTVALSKAGHGRVVTLSLTTELAENARTAVKELERPLGKDFQVYDEGARWIEPKEFRDVQPGVELVAFSSLKEGAKAQVGLTDGHGLDLKPAGETAGVPEFGPLLEREAHRAYLAHLERKEGETQDAQQKAQLRKERLDISVKHRVLCPLTALLVLESEGDYARYGIDRTALADIMVVGKNGIELARREASAALPPPPPPLRQESSDLDGRSGSRSSRPMKAKRDARDDAPAAAGPPAAAPGGGGEPAAAADRESSRSAPAESSSEGATNGGRANTADSAPAPSPAAPAMAPAAAPAMAPAPADVMGQPAPEPSAPPPAAPAAPPAERPAAAGGSARREGFTAQSVSEERERRVTRDRVDADSGAAVGAEARAQTSPGWVSQATWKPSDSYLAELKARMAANPLDRSVRNALSWALVRSRQMDALAELAFDWQGYDPDNPMVYEYLGRSFAGRRERQEALRALSSIAEVSPGDSGLLNRAGYLLINAGEPKMAELLFRFSIERRPDHVNNYRGLALALWAQGRYEDAAKALGDALGREYHGRYGNVKRILREEAGLILGAWLKAEPAAEQRIRGQASVLGADPAFTDDLRITLHWETDANDVDLHVVDPGSEECYYSHKQNRSGLNLYEDLTRGLGPETASVPTGRLEKGIYHVGVKYFSAGPMGVSRGVVTILRPTKDGKPDVQIEPFCLLPDVEGVSQDMRHVAVIESSGTN